MMAPRTKILYVEDNPLSKTLARTILEKHGYEVLEADNGLSGIELAQTERPDLVLMDINMPGLDGYEASTRLKGIPGMENVPVVAFTAKVISNDDRERMLAAGCDGYISKTSTPDDLLNQIQAYLQGKRETLDETQKEAGSRAYQQRLVERLQEQIEKLTRANEELTLINKIAQAITSTLKLDEVLTLITGQIAKTMEVTACFLLLLDKSKDMLVFKAASGPGMEQAVGHKLKLGQGIAGWVAREGQSLLLNEIQPDSRFFSKPDTPVDLETGSILCVPLRVKNKIIGVIEAVHTSEGAFDSDSLRLLESLASTAALAIENARLYSDLQEERDNLIRKEEEIRRNIARDLHDGPTQMVSALSMNIEFVKKLKVVAPERVDLELENLLQLANEAANEIRNLLFGLHPTILQTQGLEAALRVYVDRFFDRRGAKLLLDVAPNTQPRISKEAEIIAFIIVQEAVNNAKKHAEASEIMVKLRQTDDLFVIIVQDNGKGFDLDSVLRTYDERVSFGLTTMTERARLVRGQVKFHSKPGYGTAVVLSLPMEKILSSVYANGA